MEKYLSHNDTLPRHRDSVTSRLTDGLKREIIDRAFHDIVKQVYGSEGQSCSCGGELRASQALHNELLFTFMLGFPMSLSYLLSGPSNTELQHQRHQDINDFYPEMQEQIVANRLEKLASSCFAIASTVF